MSSKSELIAKYANEALTYYNLRALKWTHKGTCAVMGNINQESGFRTDAISFDGYGSLGICQWTFSRRTNLENFLKERSLPLNSLSGQCAFLDYETKSNYPKLYDCLVKDTELTLIELTDKFCREWERPAEAYANYPRRESSAELYYERYKGTYVGGDDPEEPSSGYAIDFNKTTAKLSSSDNFEYLQQDAEEEKQVASGSSTTQTIKDILNNSALSGSSNVAGNVASLLERAVSSVNVKLKQTPKISTFGEEVHGSLLPVYPTLVEAPFAEVTIGGVTFGTYSVRKNYPSYPNYVQSVEIIKTNGTINEYTINLVHQVSPGDNPNYIAELLSATGYNEIQISYGDANYGKYFRDVKALLIGVKTSFDFASCNIRYTLNATSLSYLMSTTRMNFPAVTDKPSNVILDLVEKQSELITSYFTGMRSVTEIIDRGLIPANDKEVEIEAVKDKNILEYISYLTSLMRDENDEIADKSSYYLTVNDEQYGELGNTFSIKEIISDNIKSSSLVYEVDVGYPDDNLVYDFTINSNYAWAATYSEANKITNYVYDIDNDGDLTKKKSSTLLASTLSANEFAIDTNMWKQLTRFPITATLTLKGLMAPILLLTYIKINNYYFGNKRITSGLYIVTEQRDSISGNGCTTALGLTRVASDVESITIDGRVRT